MNIRQRQVGALLTLPLLPVFLLFLLFLLFFGALPGVARADWLQFRGPQGLSATAETLPVEFGGEAGQNIAWKTPLPGRAVNSPIVVGDQVIATASSGQGQKRLHMLSLDDKTGEIQWQRRFLATGRTQCHPLSAVAAPTPSSDGERIFALFSSNDLVCLDLDGNPLWLRALTVENPNAFDDRGLASSTWVTGDTLIVQVGCSGDSFAMGIDTATGKTKWRRPLAKTTSWSTPSNVTLFDEPLVMLQSAERLLIIAPETGDIRYSLRAEANLIPSPTMAGETVLLPANGLTAVKFIEGDEEGEIAWQEAKVGAESSSPVAFGDQDQQFLVIRRPGILTAASVEDADIAWKTRLKGNSFWATPLVTPSHIYVTNSEGLIQVLTHDGEIVAENDLAEEILGSPAASRNSLYLRGTSSLIKVSPS